MVGAGRLDQRVEPLADPEHAADPGPPPFGAPEDHQGRRRDVAEPPGQQFAPVEAVEDVLLEPLRGEQGREVVRADPRPFGQGRSTSRGRRRPASGRGRTAGPAGRRSPGPSPRRPAGRAGRGRRRRSPALGVGALLDQQVVDAGDLADLLLAGEQGLEHAGLVRVRGRAPRRARPGAPRARRPAASRGLGPEPRRGRGPARPRAPGGRSTTGAGSARRPTAFAWTISPSSRRNSSDRPSSTNRSPACSRSAYAPSSVPTRPAVDLDADRFLRRDRPDVRPEPADHPAAPDAEQARPASRSGAPSTSGSSPARARRPRRGGEVAGEEVEAGVEVGPGQVGHRARTCGRGRRRRRSTIRRRRPCR